MSYKIKHSVFFHNDFKFLKFKIKNLNIAFWFWRRKTNRQYKIYILPIYVSDDDPTILNRLQPEWYYIVYELNLIIIVGKIGCTLKINWENKL
jgi:hypothetical protein